MADALASGASARKGVGVQVPPRARFLAATPESLHGFVDAKGISSSRLVDSIASRILVALGAASVILNKGLPDFTPSNIPVLM